MPRKKKKKTESEAYLYYQHRAVRAAKDLLYGRDVIEQLQNAKTTNEIGRIMKTARLGE